MLFSVQDFCSLNDYIDYLRNEIQLLDINQLRAAAGDIPTSKCTRRALKPEAIIKTLN